MSWPSVKRPRTSPSGWCASGELPRRLRLRAARSSREVAPWRPATSRARRKQASARSPVVGPRRPPPPAGPRLPADGALPPTSARRCSRPERGLRPTARWPPRCGRREGTTRREGPGSAADDAGTGAPPGLHTAFHQRDALGQVSSRSRHPTLEAGGPGEPESVALLGGRGAASRWPAAPAARCPRRIAAMRWESEVPSDRVVVGSVETLGELVGLAYPRQSLVRISLQPEEPGVPHPGRPPRAQPRRIGRARRRAVAGRRASDPPHVLGASGEIAEIKLQVRALAERTHERQLVVLRPRGQLGHSGDQIGALCEVSRRRAA